MQIIPVIDLMRGQVVHARGGQRSQYRPINSVLTQSVTLFDVIADIVRFYPFQQIYIADLDAIETGKFDLEMYQQLTREFAGIQFWIDSGIQSIAQFSLRAQDIPAQHVVGSETLQESALLQHPLFMHQGILSLDFKAGKFLGPQQLLTQARNWPKQVILMSLDRVGAGQGPDFERLQQLQQTAPECHFFAAGGVRDKTDLARLARVGTEGALVASCLHNGSLDKEQINKYSSQKHRSS